MTPPPEEFVRRFPENGLKRLLGQQPLNVRDLLHIARCDLADAIAYDKLRLDPTTYVQCDYRHVESDLVLRGPLRRPRRQVLIYILLEHQSEPDPLMIFRLLEYVLAIYRGQLRVWSQTHATFRGFEFQPVLPVVFYTGSRSWPTLGHFSDLVAGGPTFAALAPSLEPVFVNLRDTPEGQLVSEGGAFGQVLRLLQHRHAGGPAFRSLLHEVVQALERMPASQRLRWLDLLSYIHALVYHEREDVLPLQQVIEDSVQTDPHRQEVRNMGKSYAQVLEERGALRGRREMLLLQLRVKFGEVPAGVVATVETCTDVAQLDRWSESFVKARRLSDVGIPSQD